MIMPITNNTKKRIAFISSYSPRKCGIATFASDLIANLRVAAGRDFEPLVVAMDSDTNLEYQSPVKIIVHKDVEHDYLAAADYMNGSDVDVISVQHEFGLFGGDAGSYLNLLLHRLNKPVIATLHTVLAQPSKEYFDSLTTLCQHASKVVVMNKRGVRMLQRTYGLPIHKIELIPHGIPDLPFADTNPYKQSLGFAARKTILTFGLLGRNKGIEVMLKALPKIVKADPSVLYIVLGATHPEAVRHEGQSYYFELRQMVRDLAVEENVVFVNRFVSDDELHRYLRAADIYVTPYLNKEQLTSGTLAFAVGTGRAVVSTPYWAAQELLAKGRGRLVRFADSADMARSIIDILRDQVLSQRMRRLAYEHGRSITWPKIGQRYWKLFKDHVPSTTISLDLRPLSHRRGVTTYSNRQIYQPA